MNKLSKVLMCFILTGFILFTSEANALHEDGIAHKALAVPGDVMRMPAKYIQPYCHKGLDSVDIPVITSVTYSIVDLAFGLPNTAGDITDSTVGYVEDIVDFPISLIQNVLNNFEK